MEKEMEEDSLSLFPHCIAHNRSSRVAQETFEPVTWRLEERRKPRGSWEQSYE